VPTATVVAAARDLPAGELLTASDLQVLRVASSAAVASALGEVGEGVGRRTRVALPAGTLVSAALLAADPVVAAGHRRLRLAVDSDALPVAWQLGDVVDVLAAVPDSGAAGGRVVLVCTGSLVAIGPAAGSSGAETGGGASPAPASSAVTLDVDAAGAARLLWAESFAKALHLLVRSPGDTSAPPDVSGATP